MKRVSDITVAVVDSGLFLPMAFRIAEEAKRVIFCPPCEKTPCTVKSACIGDGFSEIEHRRDFWPVIDEIDLFCFPDCHHASLQLYLESIGKSVWGCRGADALELNRLGFMGLLKTLGLDVPKFEAVRGLDALRDALKDESDKYIKISRYRADMETFHWRDMAHDEGWLDWLAVNFGPLKNHMRFLIFDSIETDLEIGCDTYCADGQWPGLMLNGIEWKDKSYFAAVTKREAMPDQIKQVLEAFTPYLASHRYRQAWSMEVRVKDDKAYFIDATVRGGLPSTASQHLLWKNFTEIVWAGANGELVEPEPTAQFSIETMVTTKSEKDSWDTVELPDELKRNCRFSSCAFVDGKYCFPPDDLHTGDLGWLAAVSDTPIGALKKLQEYEALLPDGLQIDTSSLVKVIQEIESMSEAGIEFTKYKMPDVAAVIGGT